MRSHISTGVSSSTRPSRSRSAYLSMKTRARSSSPPKNSRVSWGKGAGPAAASLAAEVGSDVMAMCILQAKLMYANVGCGSAECDRSGTSPGAASRRRDQRDLRCQFGLELLAGFEPLDLLHQPIHIFDPAIHRGKPDVGDIVHPAKPFDDLIADLAAGHTRYAALSEVHLDLFGRRLEDRPGHRPALAGPHQADQDLRPVERLAAAVPLDHQDAGPLRALKGRKAPAASRPLRVPTGEGVPAGD